MNAFLICGSILILLYLFLICPRLRKPEGASFLNVCYAHRGLHDTGGRIPENSLPAFARAASAGYGIELDVQLSSDGVPVVFHDATLSRMCAIDRRVDSLTFSELQNYTLLHTGERIPSFSQVLDLVAGRVPLMVEIKMDRFDLSIPAKIDELLRSYPGPYCIESFHPAALWWYRQNRPHILRGQLATHFNVENKTFSPFQFLLGKMVLNVLSRPDFVSYNWRFRKDLSRRLCCKLFHAYSAGWVIRSEGEFATCQKSFQMYIFEDFLPKNRDGCYCGQNTLSAIKSRGNSTPRIPDGGSVDTPSPQSKALLRSGMEVQIIMNFAQQNSPPAAGGVSGTFLFAAGRFIVLFHSIRNKITYRMKKRIPLLFAAACLLIPAGCRTSSPQNPFPAFQTCIVKKVMEHYEGGAIDESDIKIDRIYAGSFSQNNATELLALCKIPNPPHVAGLDKTAAVLLDADSLETIAYQEFNADQVTIDLVQTAAGQNRVLFIGTTIYQGVATQEIQLYRIQDRQWIAIAIEGLEKVGEGCFFRAGKDVILISSAENMTTPDEITAVLFWDKDTGQYLFAE